MSIDPLAQIQLRIQRSCPALWQTCEWLAKHAASAPFADKLNILDPLARHQLIEHQASSTIRCALKERFGFIFALLQDDRLAAFPEGRVMQAWLAKHDIPQQGDVLEYLEKAFPAGLSALRDLRFAVFHSDERYSEARLEDPAVRLQAAEILAVVSYYPAVERSERVMYAFRHPDMVAARSLCSSGECLQKFMSYQAQLAAWNARP